jgi:hypothetical protein
MKETLEALKATIEKVLGVDINTLSRKQEFTYARAIFCRIAREISVGNQTPTYNEIGKIIKKNHATVLHLNNKTFFYAMQDPHYASIYNVIKSVFMKLESDSPVSLIDEVEQSLSEVELLKMENEELKKKIVMQSVIDSRISVLLSTLDERDVEPVIEKIGTIVKAMKNVRQQFEDCTVFHYE